VKRFSGSFAPIALAATIAACAGASGTTRGPRVPSGFDIQTIAHVPHARELAALPNGDLLIATSGTDVVLLPLSRGSARPATFATVDDPPVSGIAFSSTQHAIYLGGRNGVYRVPYRNGDERATATPQLVAHVRTGPVAANSDGDDHVTTSVAFSDATGSLWVSIGSSCNACVEVDPTRAAIQERRADGRLVATRGKRIRNGIALTADPVSGRVWVGDAGQDGLPAGHPYEFLDDASAHAGLADYGWPNCEEDRVAYAAGASCANVVVPLVEFPAYATLVGATFYPLHPGGRYAFPARYRGGIFVTRHGSWHTPNGCAVAPEVDFVPMHGDAPATPVDWNDPTKQWQPFVSGYQPGCGASSRIGRPTGVSVGIDGSLFVADDATGAIDRIRP